MAHVQGFVFQNRAEPSACQPEDFGIGLSSPDLNSAMAVPYRLQALNIIRPSPVGILMQVLLTARAIIDRRIL